MGGGDRLKRPEWRWDDATGVDGDSDDDCWKLKQAVPSTSGIVAAWRTDHAEVTTTRLTGVLGTPWTAVSINVSTAGATG